MTRSSHPLTVIAGPTASGKSDLAIALAQAHNGEIISADSRQVYRDMNIGTGKVSKDTASPKDIYLSQGIRHHLLDVADPGIEYNISHFLTDARAAIQDIVSRGKLPILCGGTHFWIQSLIEGANLPSVPPDPILRRTLETYTTPALFTMLEERDPTRASTIDPHNRLRLIRALEICAALGSVPSLSKNHTENTLDTDVLILILNPSTETLKKNISTRLAQRLADGMVDEVRRLHGQGLSWERLESFGLEYRFVARLLQGLLTEEALSTELSTAIWHYARRQLAWLRRWEKSGASLHRITTLDEAEALLITVLK